MVKIIIDVSYTAIVILSEYNELIFMPLHIKAIY